MMGHLITPTVVILSLAFTVAQYDHRIYVSNNSKALYNNTCWSGGTDHPCGNLSLALQAIYKTGKGIVSLDSRYLSYQLEATPYSTFQSLQYIELTTYGGGVVNIECAPGAGMSFVHTDYIVVRNITFTGCGIELNDDTLTLNSPIHHSVLNFNVALNFYNCSIVTLDNIGVVNSHGLGVVFNGTSLVTVTGGKFVNNPRNSKAAGVGGAVYIEFSNMSLSGDGTYGIANTLYTIENCSFIRNCATSNQTEKEFDHFGRGGGMSITFKAAGWVNSDNKILITNTNFTDNNAKYAGGGIYIGLHNSNNNLVNLSGLVMENNSADIGGAVSVRYFTEKDEVTNSKVLFSNSQFMSNEATLWGGAISMYTSESTNSSNVFEISNVNFTANSGSYGSALSLSASASSAPSGVQLLVPKISSCKFDSNADINHDQQFAQYGALYVNHMSVQFSGKMNFSNNSGSAIVAVTAYITFTEFTTSEFFNNTAAHGGAISILGNSVMTVSPNTTFLFTNNSAVQLGGAIYAVSVGEHTQLSENCFLQYSEKKKKKSEWIVHFMFDGNTIKDSIANSIYTPSLLPCIESEEPIVNGEAVPLSLRQMVFNWSNESWHYSNNSECCEILTKAAKLLAPSELKVVPGNSTKMYVQALDDLDQDVTNFTVLFAHSQDANVTLDEKSHYISSNYISLKFTGGNKTEYENAILLQTLSPRVLKLELNITFEQCNAGMELKNNTCKFSGFFRGVVIFNGTTSQAEILRNYWIGDNGIDIVVGYCHYCIPYFNNVSNSTGYVPLTFPVSNSSNPICLAANRTGFLCYDCINSNYSPAIFAIGSPCKKYNEAFNAWMWPVYLFVHLGYFIGLALFIAFFKISFTDAPLHASIFFAQMISTVVNINAGGIVSLPGLNITSEIYTTLYDFFNLNALHLVFQDLTIGSVDIAWAQFLVQIFPFALLNMVFILWGILFCLSSEYCASRSDYYIQHWPRICALIPGQKKLHSKIVKIGEKSINILGSFLLLSSTSLLILALRLINPTYLYVANSTIIDERMYFKPNIPYYNGIGPFAPVIAVILIGFTVAIFIITFCRYREDELRKYLSLTNILDHILAPLQKHYRTDEPNDERKCSLKATIEGATHDCPHKLPCCCLKKVTCFSGRCILNLNMTDLHWAPSAYIVFRVVLIAIYNSAWNYPMHCIMQMVTSTVAAVLVIVFRPYKQEWINVLDAVIFLDLTLLNGLNMYQYYLYKSPLTMSWWAYVFQLALILFPLFWMVGYIVSKMIARISALIRSRRREHELLLQQAPAQN